MLRFIALEALESKECAIFAVGADGKVCFMNQAAAAILKCDPQAMQGRFCWEAARFRTPDGALFCKQECQAQKLLHDGRPAPAHDLCFRRQGRCYRVELITIPINTSRDGRHALLHIIRPVTDANEALSTSDEQRAGTVEADLCELTLRELEVLRTLAQGSGTAATASQLSLSPTTVRNHIQSILHKLRVHSRVEAILIALGKKH